MTRRVVTSDRGMALVIVLLVTALLVTVITEVIFSVHMGSSIASSYKDGQRAAMLAEGGVQLAAMSVKTLFKGKAYTAFKPEEAVQAVPEGDGLLTLRIEDEQGKASVNGIVYSNGETNNDAYSQYARLLDALGLKAELADALADWIDSNDTPRASGAETEDYYGRLNRPYSTKNGSLYSTEELLLVKGYTPEAYGALSPFVTAYTDGLININTAPKEVIMSLSDGVTPEMADRAIAYREASPFKDTADIRKVAGFETIGFSLQGRITVKSNIFRVYTRGAVGGGIRDVEAVVDVSSTPKVLYWRER